MCSEPLRAILIEDEALLLILLQDWMAELGCEVVGKETTLEGALEAVESMSFDFAVLDLTLRGKMAYPVADRLKQRGTPFILMTGRNSAEIPPAYAEHPLLTKPCNFDALRGALHRIMPDRELKERKER